MAKIKRKSWWQINAGVDVGKGKPAFTEWVQTGAVTLKVGMDVLQKSINRFTVY